MIVSIQRSNHNGDKQSNRSTILDGVRNMLHDNTKHLTLPDGPLCIPIDTSVPFGPGLHCRSHRPYAGVIGDRYQRSTVA